MYYFLHNDDCYNVLKDRADSSVDCILTDVPYGVNFKNDIYDDSHDFIASQMPKWFDEWHRILKDDCYLYMFVGVKTIHEWITCGIRHNFNFKNIIATRSFNNGSPTPKNSFGFQFQPIIVFSKGKGKNYNKVDFFPTSEAWFKDKRNKNPKPYTYEYSNFIPSNICFATEKRASKNLHPNEKNVKLLKFFIDISTNEGDIVMDCFMGSGSTGVASVQSNRNFIGIELDKYYYNLSKERIEKEYNKKFNFDL